MDEDSTLVDRAKQGDQAAFNVLVKSHYEKVFGQALSMMKSREEAQDVAQLAWIKAWKKLPGFRGDSAFTSWMYRITTFTALDALRKRDSRKESLLENEHLDLAHSSETSNATPTQLQTLDRQEIRDRFNEALEQLPDAQKEALKLREIEELSYEEIAHRMNCKIGTIMSRLFNARKNIQHYLADFVT